MDTTKLKKGSIVYRVLVWDQETIPYSGPRARHYKVGLIIDEYRVDSCGKKQFTLEGDKDNYRKSFIHQIENDGRNAHWGAEFVSFHATRQDALDELDLLWKRLESITSANGSPLKFVCYRAEDRTFI